MNNNDKNLITGIIVTIALALCIFCVLGAIDAFQHNNHIGAGICFLAASLPITVALNRVLK
ncbi:MAG: hypothetical protein KDC92_07500 [Bacteroidetes bacterium]|nr:hypothetical protein [Bacteroidota bacterium]